MWRFGRYSEQKKRKSPKIAIYDDPTLIALQWTPANIHIYLTLLETRFPGLQFCRWQSICSSSNFWTVLSETQKRQLIILPSPKQILMQNGHSGSFKVIYFDVAEEPLCDYIAQYNNCGLRCGGSEDIAGKISENRHFWRPHYHLKPPRQQTPANIHISLILLETAIAGLHSNFYQRVSIASYANRWYSQRRNVRLSVRPSVCPSICHTPVLY